MKNIGEIEIASRNSEAVEAMGMMDYIVDKWNKKNTSMRKTQTLILSRMYIITALIGPRENAIIITIMICPAIKPKELKNKNLKEYQLTQQTLLSDFS